LDEESGTKGGKVRPHDEAEGEKREIIRGGKRELGKESREGREI
jgi:hypothetical protein